MPDEAALLEQITEPALPEWKRFLLDNPDAFIARYFPHKIGKLEHFHLELIRIATQERKGIVLFPAGHGKSTIVSTCLPIWEVCRDPNTRIGIVAKNMTEGEAIMRSIHAELIANDELIEDFGPFYDDDGHHGAWSLSRIDVSQRSSRSKSSTIAMFGAGSKDTLGYRVDWVICDDVVTQDNSNTPEQRFKLRQWFNQQVATMPERSDDRITVVGTLFDPSDLYNDLLELQHPLTGEPIYGGKEFDAIVDEDAHTPLWPAQWDWERLMIEKASIGTLDFNKRYRNIAVDPSRMVFREEYVKGGWANRKEYPGCIDKGFRIGDPIDPSWRVVSGFDPAIGLGKKAKFCAHVTLAQGSCPKHERCYWVLDLFRDQLSLPQQVDHILSAHEQYGCSVSMVEANSYQAGLFQALQQRMDEQGLEFRIEPHYTNRTNKPDPELGVQAMSPAFENGWVHIPWGDPASTRKMGQLVDELIQYPGRTTDTVMALWFAWRQLKINAPTYKSFNRLQKPVRKRMRTGRRIVKNPYYAKEN